MHAAVARQTVVKIDMLCCGNKTWVLKEVGVWRTTVAGTMA